MIRFVLAFCIVFFASSPTVLAAETTASFAIAKMTCATCPLTVRLAMEGVEGVIDVEVDYGTKVATVTFDDAKTNPEDIAEASTNVGFPATLNDA